MNEDARKIEESCFRLTGEVDGSQLSFDLSGGEHVIGASHGCDLPLVATGVSRRHAELVVADGALRIRDLDSKNGTFVNGRRIDEVEVDEGDWIGFGPVVLYVVRVHPDDVGMAIPLDPDRRRRQARNTTTEVRSLARRADDGRDEIIALMLNNPLGFQHALVILSARSRTTGESCGSMFSPDINAFLQARMSAPAGCLSFTMLGSDAKIVDPPKLNDGRIELLLDGEVRRFDDWGNPETSRWRRRSASKAPCRTSKAAAGWSMNPASGFPWPSGCWARRLVNSTVARTSRKRCWTGPPSTRRAPGLRSRSLNR